MKFTFLGANATVTGSRTLIEHGKTKVLIDCGLFQGVKTLRLKNRETFPIAPDQLDAVVLTHAHLDHSGYLPLLVKNGFSGPVFCSAATKDLCGILLPDSGYLQEEEAKYATKHRYSKHVKPEPLYTEADAEKSLEHLRSVQWKTRWAIGKDESKLEFELFPAGHLFGAASIRVSDGSKSILFSGDIGRENDPITNSPSVPAWADDVVIESTYGNRNHPVEDPKEALKKVILKTHARGGVLLIPSFAVGRAQTLLFYIRQLLDAGEIPNQPVYLNSPMANRASHIYVKHAGTESKLSKEELLRVCQTAKGVASIEESQAINESKGPMIIIAASGMATGGRVLHHLKAFGGDPRNTILFAGFQAAGTRGEAVVHGASEVKIHGEYWPIRAEVEQLDSMSGHADANGLLQWASKISPRPRRFFVNHGEPSAADALRRKLTDELGAETCVPESGAKVDRDQPVEIKK
jgi:metallo-beta-lactamase family protein